MQNWGDAKIPAGKKGMTFTVSVAYPEHTCNTDSYGFCAHCENIISSVKYNLNNCCNHLDGYEIDAEWNDYL